MKVGKFFKYFFIIFLGLVLTGFLVMNTVKNKVTKLDSYEVNQGGSKKVLIASEKSAWKAELIEKLISQLGQDTYIKVEGVSELDKVQPESWDHIVVIASVMMGSSHKKVERFLTKVQDKKKITFVATKTAVAPVEYGVDTISTASSPVPPEMEVGDTSALALQISGNI